MSGLVSDAELQAQLKQYEFYHVINLGNGVTTPGLTDLVPLQRPVLAEIARQDVEGKRVLDVGCRDGLFGFAAEKQGASYVLGIDNDISPAATEFLIPWFKSKMEMRQINLYDFGCIFEDRFDVVIFAGVLYHLRFPFLGLKRIADAMRDGGALIIETGMLLSHDQHPLIYSPPSRESPYDPTSVTFMNHRALEAALESLGFADVECKSILLPDATAYSGRDAFLSSPHGHLATATSIELGRATYVCNRRFAADQPEHIGALNRYWYSTHDLNSRWSVSGRKFLDAFKT